MSQTIAARAVKWPIGCFNRPWTTWSYDDALKQMKAAGYETTGLLTRTKQEPFIGADATPEYLAALKQRIAASGLKANMAALRSRHAIPLEESIKETRQQVENAATLGVRHFVGPDIEAAIDSRRIAADDFAAAPERELDAQRALACCRWTQNGENRRPFDLGDGRVHGRAQSLVPEDDEGDDEPEQNQQAQLLRARRQGHGIT